MNAQELLKKLGNKLLGKKSNTSAAGDAVPKEKALEIAFPVYDKLGVIQLHANWKN